MPSPPKNCVFETPEKRASAVLTRTDPDGENWYVLQSDFAPEDPHWLIIPEACWPEEKMRRLGGKEKLATAITLATEILSSHFDEPRYQGLLGFSIQVGMLGAQNFPHAHYHLYRPNYWRNDGELISLAAPEPQDMSCLNDDELIVFEEGGLRVLANGHYTGQAVILPNLEVPFDTAHVQIVANVLNRLIELYTKKFKTPEGDAPDYNFELQLYEGCVNFGMFWPKLNNTGTLECHALFDHRRGMNLAWSHHETAKYLREQQPTERRKI